MTLQLADWMELSGMGGLGQTEAEAVTKIQAEKAAVLAEIARLKSGGTPAAGGYAAVAAASQRRTAPPPPPPPMWPKIVGGLAVLGAGAFLWKRRKKLFR